MLYSIFIPVTVLLLTLKSCLISAQDGKTLDCTNYSDANTSAATCNKVPGRVCTKGCTGGVVAQNCTLNSGDPQSQQICTLGFGQSSATIAICINQQGSFSCVGSRSGSATCSGCIDANANTLGNNTTNTNVTTSSTASNQNTTSSTLNSSPPSQNTTESSSSTTDMSQTSSQGSTSQSISPKQTIGSNKQTSDPAQNIPTNNTATTSGNTTASMASTFQSTLKSGIGMTLLSTLVGTLVL